MKTFVVLGLGFGDEGKGLTTDYLSLNYPSPTLVVRFNGGHQAGHTVCTDDGRRHVFSNFGSGTLRGASTYWSKFCTVDPPAIAKEQAILTSKIEHGFPLLFIDKLCPVATPYDKQANRSEEVINRHGSCGVGFGSTIKRHTESPIKLFAQDLSFPYIIDQKLKSIREWYGVTKNEFAEMNFKNSLKVFNKVTVLVSEGEVFKKQFSSIIFEGAQGIMLDMDFGFFPHVTRSHTTSRNAMEIIQRNNLPIPTIFYVTRAYQTRHGAGPMSNEEQAITLSNNGDETNKQNTWQGDFRTGRLDVELLRYAISCDDNFSFHCPKSLVITCLDQLPDGNVLFTDKGGQLFATDCIPALGSSICENATLYAWFGPSADQFNKYPIKSKV